MRMQPIFDAPHLPVLHRFLGPDCLIVFDYDGTLAPIVDDRDQARMRTFSSTLLYNAALKYRVCVLSGRGRDEVSRLMEGIPLAAIVGNHGAETGLAEDDNGNRALVQSWLPLLEESLRRIGGVEVEDKQHSLSIHYRKSHGIEVEALVTRAAQSLPGAKLIGGKKVVNVLPQAAPDKALALRDLCSRLGAGRCLFIGDDVTDDVVFEATFPFPLLGIRVGPSATSAAPYFLRDQDEVDDLLREIVSLRKRPDAGQASA